MKLKIRSIFTLALATGLLLSTSTVPRVHADDQHEKACSNKTLNGSYGSYRTGTTSTGPLGRTWHSLFRRKRKRFWEPEHQQERSLHF